MRAGDPACPSETTAHVRYPPAQPRRDRDYSQDVSSKQERRAARAEVSAFHGAELNALVALVGDAVDRYRAGELDAFDVDLALQRYYRAAKELWRFCTLVSPEIAAKIIRSEPPSDWWERGQPAQR